MLKSSQSTGLCTRSGIYPIKRCNKCQGFRHLAKTSLPIPSGSCADTIPPKVQIISGGLLSMLCIFNSRTSFPIYHHTSRSVLQLRRESGNKYLQSPANGISNKDAPRSLHRFSFLEPGGDGAATLALQRVHLQAFADNFDFLANAGQTGSKNLGNKALQTFSRPGLKSTN
ncbi:hypothetical protein AVEN_19254-1 [Araneus ventricosus]|uniref:Uncharacterized protein n=1 Tax=Araneus ventricosus TaxID=182803 RepID=A0A4Y2MRI1_ARAVE|nr:hypothetical protein AVEN_19254-1 [Araneus ventricosus]